MGALLVHGGDVCVCVCVCVWMGDSNSVSYWFL